MAFIFQDGMDAYSSASQVADKWDSANTSTIATSGGRFGGGAVTSNSSSVQLVKNINWSVSNGALCFGFWCKASTSTTFNTSPGIGILMAENGTLATYNFCQGIASSTALKVLTLGAATATNGSKTVLDGNWHWIEFAVFFSITSSGYIKMYVDGVLDINYSGATVDTSAHLPTTVTSITFNPYSISGGGSSLASIDDVVIYDTSGSGNFSSFPMGPIRINTFAPTGDGSSTQWTPSTAGSHYPMVNTGYGSATYVSDSSTGHIDYYTYGTMPYTPQTIYGVCGNYYAQNPGTGTANLIPALKTGSNTTTGSTTGLTSATYKNIQGMFLTDAGGSAWTVSTVNAMQLGMSD